MIRRAVRMIVDTWRMGGELSRFDERGNLTLEGLEGQAVAEAIVSIHRRGLASRWAVCDTGCAGERVTSIHRSLLGARLEVEGRRRGVIRVVSTNVQVGWPSRDYTLVPACVNVMLAGLPTAGASVKGEGR